MSSTQDSSAPPCEFMRESFHPSPRGAGAGRQLVPRLGACGPEENACGGGRGCRRRGRGPDLLRDATSTALSRTVLEVVAAFAGPSGGVRCGSSSPDVARRAVARHLRGWAERRRPWRDLRASWAPVPWCCGRGETDLDRCRGARTVLQECRRRNPAFPPVRRPAAPLAADWRLGRPVERGERLKQTLSQPPGAECVASLWGALRSSCGSGLRPPGRSSAGAGHASAVGRRLQDDPTCRHVHTRWRGCGYLADHFDGDMPPLAAPLRGRRGDPSRLSCCSGRLQYCGSRHGRRRRPVWPARSPPPP